MPSSMYKNILIYGWKDRVPMRAYERFIQYVKVHTASSEDSLETPTTLRQFDLSRLLAREMEELGMEGVSVDEHAYVYGFIPASEGFENRPCIGLIAHLDTIPDFSGENVKSVPVAVKPIRLYILRRKSGELRVRQWNNS